MKPVLVLAAIVSASAAAAASPETRLDRVRVEVRDGRTSIELVGAGAASFTTSSPPGGLIVDLASAKLGSPCREADAAGAVGSVRCEQKGRGVRVELGFRGDVEARLSTKGRSLVIHLEPGLGAAPAIASGSAVERGAAPTPEAERKAAAGATPERKAVEAATLAEMEREAAAGATLAEMEQKTVEGATLAEMERKAAAGATLAEMERKTAAGATPERKAVEAGALSEARRKAAEAAALAEAGRKAAEAAALAEAERKAEAAALAEAERKAVEATALAEAERKAVEAAALAEAGRKAVEAAAHAEAERQAAEAALLAAAEAERRAAALAKAGAERPATRPAASGDVEISHLGFHATGEGARITLRHSAPPSWRIREEGGKLVLEIRGGRLARPNDRRSIDASFFGTPVGLIRPVEDTRAGLVAIEISMRRKVPYIVSEGDEELAIEFAR